MSLRVLISLFTLIFIFILTALIGVWAAYDQAVAWFKFWLIVGSLLASAGVVVAGQISQKALGLAALGAALLAGGVSAYVLMTYDWSGNHRIEFWLLQRAGLWLQAQRPVVAGLSNLHQKDAAATLVLLLALGAGGAAWAWQRRYWLLVLLSLPALLLGLISIMLTSSRGAWLALIIGALVAAYLHWRAGAAWWRPLLDGLLLGIVAFGFVFVLGQMWGGALTGFALPAEEELLALPKGDAIRRRVRFLQDMLLLVGDYPFTGSGLGSTSMVFSSYVILLHVEYRVYAPNLFLQVAIEQGLLGLFAFIGLLGLACWSLLRSYDHNTFPIFRTATTIALVALLVQGMLDGESNFSWALLFQFLPLGFAFALLPLQPDKRRLPSSRRHRRAGIEGLLWRPLALTTFIVCLFFLFMLALFGQAAFQANLGAVAQTRAELSRYEWPTFPVQDALRRRLDVDLAPAIAHYEAALALDPINATANRRLGQIALSQGDYEAARRYLEAAYITAPHQRPTRQMLGESYALNGELEHAVALWHSLEMRNGQLALRQWWYEHIKAADGEHASRFAAAVSAYDRTDKK